MKHMKHVKQEHNPKIYQKHISISLNNELDQLLSKGLRADGQEPR